MMNGSRILEGLVPDVDATVVSRILDAGGGILGKAVCENLCFDGASFTSATGPVLNPYDQTRMTGGSSSGSAALVRSDSLHLPDVWRRVRRRYRLIDAPLLKISHQTNYPCKNFSTIVVKMESRKKV